MRLSNLVLLLFLAAAGVVYAQDDTDTTAAPAKPKFTPIEIQTFGWGRHATNGFYYQGSPLQNFDQFKTVIDPLGDAQASQFLRVSANEDGWGNGLFWGGILMTAAAWVDFGIELGTMSQTTYPNGALYPVTTFHDPDLGPFAVLISAGTLSWVGGMFLMSDAGTDRYNAVNRYNYVVQNGRSLSLNFLPESHQPELSFTQRF